MEIKKEDLMQAEGIRKVNQDGVDYFCISDVAAYVKEDFKMVRPVKFEFKGIELSFATIEQIEKSRYKEPLSDFDKMLLKIKKVSE